MVAGRSAKAGTHEGGAVVGRRWGEEVTSAGAGAAATGREGGDVGVLGDGGAGERRKRE